MLLSTPVTHKATRREIAVVEGVRKVMAVEKSLQGQLVYSSCMAVFRVRYRAYGYVLVVFGGTGTFCSDIMSLPYIAIPVMCTELAGTVPYDSVFLQRNAPCINEDWCHSILALHHLDCSRILLGVIFTCDYVSYHQPLSLRDSTAQSNLKS
jgi:hypothetical protein